MTFNNHFVPNWQKFSDLWMTVWLLIVSNLGRRFSGSCTICAPYLAKIPITEDNATLDRLLLHGPCHVVWVEHCTYFSSDFYRATISTFRCRSSGRDKNAIREYGIVNRFVCGATRVPQGSRVWITSNDTGPYVNEAKTDWEHRWEHRVFKTNRLFRYPLSVRDLIIRKYTT